MKALANSQQRSRRVRREFRLLSPSLSCWHSP
jgi:hypothetical protein